MPRTTPVQDDHEEPLMDYDEALEVLDARGSGPFGAARAGPAQGSRVPGGSQGSRGTPVDSTMNAPHLVDLASVQDLVSRMMTDQNSLRTREVSKAIESL